MMQSMTFGPARAAGDFPPGAPLHIAFGVDAHYAPAMAVTMISIAANNPAGSIVFHVVADSLPSGDVKMLERLAARIKTTIMLHPLDRKAFSMLPDIRSLSYAAYNRLFLCEILKDIAARVLYLDSDIVCLRAIPPLPDLGDAVAAAVLDYDQADKNAGIGRPAATPYFNSGVMYIDVKRWNERGITDQVIRVLLANKKFRLPDQDALNLVLAGQVAWLDGAWNMLWEIFHADRATHSDAVFLHYALHKPWRAWSPAFLDPPFAAHFRDSPWPARRLLDPVTRKHKGQYARYLFWRGDLFRSLFWFAKFLCARRKAAA